MQAQIEACKQSAKKEGNLENAKAELGRFEMQIKYAKENPKAVAEVDKEAMQERLEKENQASIWKKHRDLLSKRIDTVTSFMSKNRKELTSLLDAADKLFKSSGDFDLAMSQLRVAEARTDYIEKNPEGVEISTRNKLPEIAAKWRSKLEDMKKGFDELAGTVEKLPTTQVPEEVKKGVKSAVAEAKGLLNPAAFDTAVAKLTDRNVSDKAKLPERETALRTVSTLLAQFEQNPLLRQLSGNPFIKEKVHAGIVASRFALLDMQQNLLGCLSKDAYK